MIELRLTIDLGQEPVSGQILGLSDAEPTPFVGYVALISALERLCTAARGETADDLERQQQ
jgi:hypothetical protein